LTTCHPEPTGAAVLPPFPCDNAAPTVRAASRSPPATCDPPLQAFLIVPRTLKFVYYILITSAFCANILVVAQTTIISVLGASLALRGPDGSMMVATDGLYAERAPIFRSFGHGLVLTVGSVVMAVWLHLSWEASLVCCAIALGALWRMVGTYRRIVKKFDFDESLTVDFQDIFEGPASVHVVPMSLWGGLNGSRVGRAGTGKGSFDAESDNRQASGHDDITAEEAALVRRQRHMQTV
jgi:hypothetical protein